MTHDGDTYPINEGRYVVGWYAACSCGWTGDERPPDHRGKAVADLLNHHRDSGKD